MKKLFFTATMFIFILFFFIFLYISSKTIKVDINLLHTNTQSQLSNEQINIACYVLTQNFESQNNNQISKLVSEMYFSQFHRRYKSVTSIERRFIIFATSRYIKKFIYYKDCYNYLFSNMYFGNGIYGINNASKYYFNKEYQDLTSDEFIKLCLLTTNPILYDLGITNNNYVNIKIS